MLELRKETRFDVKKLPPVFKSLVVHGEMETFTCRTADAGTYGLGLMAEKDYFPLVQTGSKVRVDFGDFEVDTRVMNRLQSSLLGTEDFRFGLFLYDDSQLQPYWNLLGNIRAY